MKIRKFNELYEQEPKENWGSDISNTNYYTFTCDITVRASSQEEAEDKMEFIANQSQDVELGVYNLSYKTENGEGKMAGEEQKEPTPMNQPQNVMEKKKVNYRKRK